MKKIKINKKSDKPLYAQIRDALQKAIQEGDLKQGERLPTVIAFSRELGVTQATIRRALEDLTKAGHILSHVGRGTFVSAPPTADQKSGNQNTASRAYPDIEPTDQEAVLAARRLRMGIAQSLNELMVLARRPGIIAFTSGVPDPGLIREGAFNAVVQDAMQKDQRIYLNYGENEGMPELREEIARRFSRKGSQVSADHVLLTNGSQQAIALLAQAAAESRHRIICEVPCYMGLTNAFGAFGHWVETIMRDFEGPIPEQLQRFRDNKPSYLYVCPELHNPMGTDMSPERRKILVKWAREQRATLITDEIYQDLRFDGMVPTSLLSELGPDQTVVVGSLSKSFMCGLRVGWLITSAERVRSLVPLKRAMDIACPPLMHGIALSLFRTGEYDAHLQLVREQYRLRRDAALEALSRWMPESVKWTVPEGGFQMWVELPRGYSSIALFLLAIERGTAFMPGPLQDINNRFIHAFRLCYGSVSRSRLQKE